MMSVAASTMKDGTSLQTRIREAPSCWSMLPSAQRPMSARVRRRRLRARTHPEPRLNLGIATTESDASTRASVLLDEKQNIMVSGISGMVVKGRNEEKT